MVMTNNILIVDDLAINRKLLKTLIQKSMDDIFVIEAEDGQNGLEIIKSTDIKVIILDVMMPEMGGIEVLEKIKSMPEYKDIPVIMCSAVNEIESVGKALSLGALDYFTKPLTEEQMRITLPLKIKNALEFYEQKKQLTKFYTHIKDEMLLAEQLQKSLISEYSGLKAVEMWGRYTPCEEIGGDFFCCRQQEDKTWFMIADVSGHGISAAMVSTMLNVMFNSSIQYCQTPGAVLDNMNKNILETFGGSELGILSAFVGCVDGDALLFSNAGHPYPVLVKVKEGTAEEIQQDGFLLGVFESAAYPTQSRNIDAGDTIVLYTDGLFDTGEDNSFVDWSRVLEFCRRNKREFTGDVKVLIEKMAASFASSRKDGFTDDVAVMVIRKL